METRYRLADFSIIMLLDLVLLANKEGVDTEEILTSAYQQGVHIWD